MAKGIKRGLLIAVIVIALVALYVYFKYDPEVWIVFAHRLSNALFQIGLLFLIIGVVIFSRFGSYRRRMGLKNYWAMMKFKQQEEFEQLKKDEEELNKRDKERMKEQGRDITLLVSAVAMLVISILLTVNQA
ncbi:MAG: hypothetical protein WCC10_01755 [Tumebacillaceae bacterium]